jgi:outer membrane protein assembly factor BamB
VAVEDRVYVALGIDQPLVELDATTGETLHIYKETTKAEEVICSDGMLLVVSDRAPHEQDTFVWTDPVCWTVGNDVSKVRQWGGDRRSIFAVQAKTGRVIWAKESNVSPSTLSTDGRRVVYFDGQKLVCLDKKTGQPIWVSDNVTNGPVTYPSFSLPIMVMYKDVVLLASNNKIQAFSLDSGEKLWEKPKLRGGHRSADDLMCLDDLVWTADVARSNRMIGYDLHTGQEKRNFECDAEGYWFHHRCHRSKATAKYFMPSRTGIEYVDWNAEHWDRNHWVRGACILGVIPANGLTYAPQHPCACYMETKLTGLNALTASRASQAQLAIPEDRRLEPGPAFSKAFQSNASAAGSDWPTYRADNTRSGHIKTEVGDALQTAWSTKLGGKLSAITAAEGRVFISAIDEHTVYALNQNDGEIDWNFTAGGRVDSPPTLFKGRAYFGCNDGYVYCLRISDGTLVWRYLAARGRRKQVAFEQVESLWPVHGSVLIRNGVINCVAGRSAFLDGGMRFCRIDAGSGKLLSETIIDDKVPGTEEKLDDRMAGLNMPPALPDVLSCDDKYIYMRSQEFTFDGKRTNIEADNDPTLQFGDNRHLFCSVGFLDDSWFHRTYWMYGGTITSGCNFWFFGGRYAPAGRIMCFDDESIYSFGRLPKYYMWTPALEYRLYAAKKEVTAEMVDRVKAGVRKLAQKDSRWIFNREVSGTLSVEDSSVSEVRWSQDMPKMQTRAMALAGRNLFVAGPPDLLDEEQAVTSHWDPELATAIEEQDAALLGQRGAMLWVVSAEDGKRSDEIELKSPPVWDGMAAAAGRLFMGTMDGVVYAFESK